MFEVKKFSNDLVKKINTRDELYTTYLPKEIPKIPISDKWIPKPVVMTERFEKIAERVHNFEVREDDVWVLTFPKCGTTWALEMIWLIMHDYDFDTAKKVDLKIRSPFLEIGGLSPQYVGDSVEKAAKSTPPRLIKSHLQMYLLPKALWTVKPKTIIVARNPKDTAISYFHHYRLVANYEGDLKTFLDGFLTDNLVFSPYWQHVLQSWELSKQPNVLFLTYERMKRDLKSVIVDCCEFLGKPHNDEIVEKLADHLSFDNMKKNSACNNSDLDRIRYNENGEKIEEIKFIRKGQVGSFKTEMSQEYIEKFDKWTKENLKDSDLSFD